MQKILKSRYRWIGSTKERGVILLTGTHHSFRTEVEIKKRKQTPREFCASYGVQKWKHICQSVGVTGVVCIKTTLIVRHTW